MPRALSVNFHFTRACNAKCRFCFATFRDVNGQIATDRARRVIDLLAQAGCQKLNFVGGEPTLRRDLGVLLRHAHDRGIVTSLVTNGFRLAPLLDDHADVIDWVGLSVDSGCEATQQALGRGDGDHVAQTIAHAARCRALGIGVKLNTVVTALSWREDMSALIRAVAPERWKVFQVLPIGGQNDGVVDDLLITAEQLAAFVARHAPLAAEGLGPIVEDNDEMMGSYVMIDPIGRFFGNATGRHVYSRPILDVGVEAALREVDFSERKFAARGGVYAWERPERALPAA